MPSAPTQKVSDDPGLPLAAQVDSANAQAKLFRDKADAVRQRSAQAAKAVGGLGTTAIAALGITKFSDVFPTEGQYEWVALLIGGFLAMAVAVGLISRRLWQVNDVMYVTSSLDTMPDLQDEPEATRNAVKQIFDDMARLNSAPSLQAYEARGLRFLRMAERRPGDDTAVKSLRDRASLISAEVAATQVQAAFLVTRRRSRHAVLSWSFAIFLALFVVGFGVAAISSDKLAAEREKTSLAKTCADSVAAISKQSNLKTDGLLSNDCTLISPPPPDPAKAQEKPEAAAQRAKSLQLLSAQYTECVANQRGADACSPILALIKTLST